MEEIPENQSGLEDTGETSTFDLDLQRADDIQTVEQVLADNGISNVTYRFYDNDGGYCYSSPELDYDRARRETKGGKNCKLGVFIGNKIIRMVPFPLSPIDPTSPPATNGNGNGHSEMGFLKELLLKLIEKGNTSQTAAPVPTLADMTTALANLDTLRGKQESAMETFIKGLEFGQSSSGQTDWKTDLIRTAKDALPHVTEAITAMRGGNPTPHPNNGNGQPVAMPPEHIIKAGLEYLKKKAIAGKDPELILDWVVNNAEEYQEFLNVVLNTEFADIVKLDPEIGNEPYLSWFRSVFDGLRREFIESNSVDEHSGGNSGDGDHARSDGEPREAGSTKPKG